MRLPRILAAYTFSSSPTYELLDAPSLPTSTTAASSSSSGVKRRRMSSSASTHQPRIRIRVQSQPVSIAAIIFFPVVALTAGFLIYHFIFRFDAVEEFFHGYPDVPEYDEYVAWEDRLPQHNTSLEFPEGLNGRYVMFSNQQWGYGLNNQLQEILLLSHLSYLSRRAYVFQPYTWDANAKSNAVLEGRSWRSSRIPLSVFISGPTAGGAFAAGDASPRAVNKNWWDKVCPPNRRTKLDVGAEHAKWALTPDVSGKDLMERWTKRLARMEDVCVEVSGDVIFSFPLIDSPRLLSLWPSFSNSPILTRFAWSNLIDAAVSRNLPKFYAPVAASEPDDAPPRLPDEPPPPPSVAPPSLPSTPSDPNSPSPYKSYPRNASPDPQPPSRNRRPPSPAPAPAPKPKPEPGISSFSFQSSSHDFPSSSSNTSQTIKGLIAVHLRRGDFKLHCHKLADISDPFMGWNQFPYLLDRFTPPPKGEGLKGSLDVITRGRKHDLYMERCWPEIDAIVKRLREVRRLHTGLERVFVLTNGKKEWVELLKRALMNTKDDGDDAGDTEKEREGSGPPITIPGAIRVQPVPPTSRENRPWIEVLTSKDLSILWTEREVDQAVDMEIARRAEVFLGNGFSSLTSNILMLRLSDGTPIENNRFW
ncbi:hypothetical protein FRB94_013086 [Tulasnella sp. JGI-2019a]|nr:hypothetical protein FRB94_013086 [Tulasnella sp. JGI-2019a]